MQYWLALLLTLHWGTGAGPGEAAADASLPAWSVDYQTLLSHGAGKIAEQWQPSITAERGAWATGWYGAWWIQHQVERRGQYDPIRYVEEARRLGIKNVFYFDAGEHGEFVALVSEDGRLLRSQWELRFYRNEPGRLMWFGKDAFYQDENPLRLRADPRTDTGGPGGQEITTPQEGREPALKNYRDFGLTPWRLPDGTRPKRVYDLAQWSLAGKRDRWEYSGVRVSPETAKTLRIDEFLAAGPDPVPAEAQGSLGRICSYDHSNPFLLADFQAGVGMMLGLQPAFLHFDNYFDNELLYPAQQSFGPWSLENFRRFLRAHAEEARAAGIEDIEAFDLRRYLEARRGDRPPAAAWRDSRWHEDPVWNLFVCSKLADSLRLFRPLYAFCKSESRRHGEAVIVAGNTIPLFPGSTHAAGALDLAHFEHHAAVQYGPIRVPTGLPPLGRLGGIVRLGAALGRVGYCWPSVYVPKELSGSGHENLHRVMAFDCLANRGVLDYGHQYLKGYSPGSDASAARIDAFIKCNAETYGRRKPWCDVGLVFPGETLLGNVSVFSMDPEPALYEYLGWAQALTESHVQWDVVTDLQLDGDRAPAYRVLVLPAAACLDDAAISALQRHLRSGGRLVISGPAGTRYGTERFLGRRVPQETLASRLAAASVAGWQSITPLGRGFYEDIASGQRHANRDQMQQAVQIALEGRPLLTTDASTRVGLSAFRDGDTAVLLDVVNYDLDLDSDRLQPTGTLRVQIDPPPGAAFVPDSVTMISPDWRGNADGKTPPATEARPGYPARPVAAERLPNGGLRLDLPEVAVYVRVHIPLRQLP